MSQIKDLIADVDTSDNAALSAAASQARELDRRAGQLPEEHERRIREDVRRPLRAVRGR